MVRRVYGKANDFDIIFNHIEGDRWETILPGNMYGEYVVELYAEDTAGNVSYFCTMLFIIFGHTVQCYIVPEGFSGKVETRDYKGYAEIKDLFTVIEKHKYHASVVERGYILHAAKC